MKVNEGERDGNKCNLREEEKRRAIARHTETSIIAVTTCSTTIYLIEKHAQMGKTNIFKI